MNNQRVKVIDTIAPLQTVGHDPYVRPVGCKPIRLIPVSAVSDIGRYYTWQEMKARLAKVNNCNDLTGRRFCMKVTNGSEYPVNDDDEFQTALKVSEPCGGGAIYCCN